MTNGIIDSGQEIVTNGLVLHLDAAQRRSYSGTGTRWTDLSGNGNNGTLTNGPTFNSANGGSIQFDGTNDNVLIPNATSIISTTALTIAMWVKWTTVGTTTSTIQALFDNKHYTGQGSVIQDRPDLDKKLSFSVNPSEGSVLSTSIVGDGAWKYVVCTYVGGIGKIYVNGILEGQGSQSSVSPIQPNITLGIWQYSNTRALNGLIATTSVYNRALSDAEVLQNYNATKARFQVPPVLDLYPNAAAAYSLRKLRSGYTGSAIRVRRSSDNTEQDIGFTSTGDLDTTALTTFVGANNGFVTTWYDQSGTNNNAVQTTQANQPIIVSSGTVVVENGKPSIRYNGSNNFFRSSNTLSLDNRWTIINVLNGNASIGSYQTIFSRTTSSTSIGTLHIAQYISNNNLQNIFYPNGDSRQFTTPTTYNVFNSQKILVNEWDSGNYNIVVNNNLQNYTFNSSTGFTTALNFAIGAELNGTLPFAGTMQEIIIYKLYQATSRVGLQNNINSYYGIYNSNIDSDAQSFITAAAITDSTQQGAVDALVKDLKNYGLWTKMKAIYPFVGGTAAAHKFNLKEPRDLDAAFRLVFNGTWTHTSSGATSGSSSNATTYFIPETNATRGNRSFGVYTRSTNQATLISSISSTNSSVGDFITPNAPTFRFGQGYNATTITSPITAAGFYYMSRVPGGTYKQTIYLNGNLIGTGSADEQTSYLLTNSTVIEGSLIAFSYISEGLTDAQMVNLYTAVQKYQTTLGRQV